MPKYNFTDINSSVFQRSSNCTFFRVYLKAAEVTSTSTSPSGPVVITYIPLHRQVTVSPALQDLLTSLSQNLQFPD